jgi:GMP synthase PP-ATPase subunit
MAVMSLKKSHHNVLGLNAMMKLFLFHMFEYCLKSNLNYIGVDF